MSCITLTGAVFFFSSRRRHTRLQGDWSSDVCSSDLIAARFEPRATNGKAVTVLGAKANNLRSVDVTFPLGVITVVTGVSGSGKSTLVNDILYKALARQLNRSRAEPGAHKAISVAETIAQDI